MNDTPPIFLRVSLSTLRNLLFDTGGLDKEYIERETIPFSTIAEIDSEEKFFHYDIVAKRLWQIRAWKISSERLYKERELSSKRTSLWRLQEECKETFAHALYKLSGADMETGRAICERLLRKKDWGKLFDVAGINVESDDKWKGLKDG